MAVNVKIRKGSVAYGEYRTTVNRIALTMLFFFLNINVLSLIGSVIAELFDKYLVAELVPILTDTLDALIYIISFLTPAAFYKSVFKSQEYLPLGAEPVLPKYTLFYCGMIIGLVYAASIMNSLIMQVFYIATQSVPNLPETEFTGAWSFVMAFISTAIIPGFVEEFLFRGVILRNLLPYGKTVSIVVSSLMFALMHQNLLQFFYTFSAGLLLGWLYTKTGSIWASVIVHTVNNGLSVIQEILSHYFNEYTANLFESLMILFVFLVSILSLAFLIGKKRKQSGLRKGSVFGVTERIPAPSGSLAITDREAVKGFFSPMMVAVIFVSLILALIVFAVLCMPASEVLCI